MYVIICFFYIYKKRCFLNNIFFIINILLLDSERLKEICKDFFYFVFIIFDYVIEYLVIFVLLIVGECNNIFIGVS